MTFCCLLKQAQMAYDETKYGLITAWIAFLTDMSQGLYRRKIKCITWIEVGRLRLILVMLLRKTLIYFSQIVESYLVLCCNG